MSMDDLLRDTLRDDHWALPVAADTLERVRRGRRAHRRRTAAVCAVGCLALLGGAVTLGSVSFGQGQTATLGQYAEGFPSGQPVPGISPDWTPTSGRDWLLTEEQEGAFIASHQVPSQALYGPAGSAPSPAPVTSVTAELQAYADGAGLPDGSTFRSDEAYDNDARISVLHVTLPGGAPVWLQRARLSRPEPTTYGTDVNRITATPVADVDGTTSAMTTYANYHFGFGSFYNAQGPAHAVKVVTVGGIEWTWIAPGPVALSRLTTWALAAAQA